MHQGHDKLVYMANQIATFFESQPREDGPAGIAIHINKFWEPRMRRQLFAHIDTGGAGLKPMVLEAAAKINRPPEEDGIGTVRDAAAGAPQGKGTAAGEAKSETNFPEHPAG